MDRTIAISTEVFAAIWTQRQEGEETEDAILSRLLGCNRGSAASGTSAGTEGVRDDRNGVTFPEGFEIVRTYKGRQHVAVARGGMWIHKDSGRAFASLNQLNSTIAAGNENVWNGNWKFRTNSGAMRSIAALRR